MHVQHMKYLRRVKRDLPQAHLRATDVLYQKMHAYNKEAKEILNYLIEQMKLQNKNAPALKTLYQLMAKADDVAIDCAHKLAPYQTPKLESIEVKSKTIHQFVLRAPQSVKSVEQWMAQTGAEKLNSELVNRKLDNKVMDIEPSIHDYDQDEDEINTHRELLN